MKLSTKDKSFLLLISAILIVLWAVFSFSSNIFFSANFKNSDIQKIFSKPDQKWLNLSKPIIDEDLKDRVILLHFWNRSCISCIATLFDIKKLEQKFGNKLLVIGIYSAKFDSEKNYQLIENAVLKHDITHPILVDDDLKIWNNFKIKAWPSFVLINPHGNEVETYVGENSVVEMSRDVKKIISRYRYRLNSNPLPITPEKYNKIGNVLRFPSKLAYSSSLSYKSRQYSAIFISNSGQNNIVISALNGDIIEKIGGAEEGLVDGIFDDATFNSPSGILFNDNKLYVADSGNHALRVIDFKEGLVKTLVGSGVKGDVISDATAIDAALVNLSSPSDVEFFPDKNTIAISNSGTNQILLYHLKDHKISVLAGSGKEGMLDGKGRASSLAQTSDMSAFQGKLYFLDALTSSLRVVDKSGDVKTLIGQGEKFGHANGAKEKALMQHPLALTVDNSGVYIADSFNHRIRKYDFSSKQIRDLVGAESDDDFGAKTRFDSPEGIISIANNFYISDSGNNRLLILNRSKLNSTLLNVMPPLKLPKEGFLEYLPNLQKSTVISLKENAEIILKIDVNDGWKINEDGPSFINLLELVSDDKADLISSFDWHAVKSKEMKLPKLSSSKNYLMQGTIYYCEDKINSLCYLKSYEQKISADGDDKSLQIDVKLGY